MAKASQTPEDVSCIYDHYSNIIEQDEVIIISDDEDDCGISLSHNVGSCNSDEETVQKMGDIAIRRLREFVEFGANNRLTRFVGRPEAGDESEDDNFRYESPISKYVKEKEQKNSSSTLTFRGSKGQVKEPILSVGLGHAQTDHDDHDDESSSYGTQLEALADINMVTKDVIREEYGPKIEVMSTVAGTKCRGFIKSTKNCTHSGLVSDDEIKSCSAIPKATELPTVKGHNNTSFMMEEKKLSTISSKEGKHGEEEKKVTGHQKRSYKQRGRTKRSKTKPINTFATDVHQTSNTMHRRQFDGNKNKLLPESDSMQSIPNRQLGRINEITSELFINVEDERKHETNLPALEPFSMENLIIDQQDKMPLQLLEDMQNEDDMVDMYFRLSPSAQSVCEMTETHLEIIKEEQRFLELTEKSADKKHSCNTDSVRTEAELTLYRLEKSEDKNKLILVPSIIKTTHCSPNETDQDISNEEIIEIESEDESDKRVIETRELHSTESNSNIDTLSEVRQLTVDTIITTNCCSSNKTYQNISNEEIINIESEDESDKRAIETIELYPTGSNNNVDAPFEAKQSKLNLIDSNQLVVDGTKSMVTSEYEQNENDCFEKLTDIRTNIIGTKKFETKNEDSISNGSKKNVSQIFARKSDEKSTLDDNFAGELVNADCSPSNTVDIVCKADERQANAKNDCLASGIHTTVYQENTSTLVRDRDKLRTYSRTYKIECSSCKSDITEDSKKCARVESNDIYYEISGNEDKVSAMNGFSFKKEENVQSLNVKNSVGRSFEAKFNTDWVVSDLGLCSVDEKISLPAFVINNYSNEEKSVEINSRRDNNKYLGSINEQIKMILDEVVGLNLSILRTIKDELIDKKADDTPATYLRKEQREEGVMECKLVPVLASTMPINNKLTNDVIEMECISLTTKTNEEYMEKEDPTDTENISNLKNLDKVVHETYDSSKPEEIELDSKFERVTSHNHLCSDRKKECEKIRDIVKLRLMTDETGDAIQTKPMLESTTSNVRLHENTRMKDTEEAAEEEECQLTLQNTQHTASLPIQEYAFSHITLERQCSGEKLNSSDIENNELLATDQRVPQTVHQQKYDGSVIVTRTSQSCNNCNEANIDSSILCGLYDKFITNENTPKPEKIFPMESVGRCLSKIKKKCLFSKLDRLRNVEGNETSKINCEGTTIDDISFIVRLDCQNTATSSTETEKNEVVLPPHIIHEKESYNFVLNDNLSTIKPYQQNNHQMTSLPPQEKHDKYFLKIIELKDTNMENNKTDEFIEIGQIRCIRCTISNTLLQPKCTDTESQTSLDCDCLVRDLYDKFPANEEIPKQENLIPVQMRRIEKCLRNIKRKCVWPNVEESKNKYLSTIRDNKNIVGVRLKPQDTVTTNKEFRMRKAKQGSFLTTKIDVAKSCNLIFHHRFFLIEPPKENLNQSSSFAVAKHQTYSFHKLSKNACSPNMTGEHIIEAKQNSSILEIEETNTVIDIRDIAYSLSKRPHAIPQLEYQYIYTDYQTSHGCKYCGGFRGKCSIICALYDELINLHHQKRRIDEYMRKIKKCIWLQLENSENIAIEAMPINNYKPMICERRPIAKRECHAVPTCSEIAIMGTKAEGLFPTVKILGRNYTLYIGFSENSQKLRAITCSNGMFGGQGSEAKQISCDREYNNICNAYQNIGSMFSKLLHVQTVQNLENNTTLHVCKNEAYSMHPSVRSLCVTSPSSNYWYEVNGESSQFEKLKPLKEKWFCERLRGMKRKCHLTQLENVKLLKNNNMSTIHGIEIKSSTIEGAEFHGTQTSSKERRKEENKQSVFSTTKINNEESCRILLHDRCLLIRPIEKKYRKDQDVAQGTVKLEERKSHDTFIKQFEGNSEQNGIKLKLDNTIANEKEKNESELHNMDIEMQKTSSIDNMTANVTDRKFTIKSSKQKSVKMPPDLIHTDILGQPNRSNNNFYKTKQQNITQCNSIFNITRVCTTDKAKIESTVFQRGKNCQTQNEKNDNKLDDINGKLIKTNRCDMIKVPTIDAASLFVQQLKENDKQNTTLKDQYISETKNVAKNVSAKCIEQNNFIKENPRPQETRKVKHVALFQFGIPGNEYKNNKTTSKPCRLEIRHCKNVPSIKQTTANECRSSKVRENQNSVCSKSIKQKLCPQSIRYPNGPMNHSGKKLNNNNLTIGVKQHQKLEEPRSSLFFRDMKTQLQESDANQTADKAFIMVDENTDKLVSTRDSIRDRTSKLIQSEKERRHKHQISSNSQNNDVKGIACQKAGPLRLNFAVKKSCESKDNGFGDRQTKTNKIQSLYLKRKLHGNNFEKGSLYQTWIDREKSDIELLIRKSKSSTSHFSMPIKKEHGTESFKQQRLTSGDSHNSSLDMPLKLRSYSLGALPKRKSSNQSFRSDISTSLEEGTSQSSSCLKKLIQEKRKKKIVKGDIDNLKKINDNRVGKRSKLSARHSSQVIVDQLVKHSDQKKRLCERNILNTARKTHSKNQLKSQFLRLGKSECHVEEEQLYRPQPEVYTQKINSGRGIYLIRKDSNGEIKCSLLKKQGQRSCSTNTTHSNISSSRRNRSIINSNKITSKRIASCFSTNQEYTRDEKNELESRLDSKRAEIGKVPISYSGKKLHSTLCQNISDQVRNKKGIIYKEQTKENWNLSYEGISKIKSRKISKAIEHVVIRDQKQDLLRKRQLEIKKRKRSHKRKYYIPMKQKSSAQFVSVGFSKHRDQKIVKYNRKQSKKKFLGEEELDGHEIKKPKIDSSNKKRKRIVTECSEQKSRKRTRKRKRSTNCESSFYESILGVDIKKRKTSKLKLKPSESHGKFDKQGSHTREIFSNKQLGIRIERLKFLDKKIGEHWTPMTSITRSLIRTNLQETTEQSQIRKEHHLMKSTDLVPDNKRRENMLRKKKRRASISHQPTYELQKTRYSLRRRARSKSCGACASEDSESPWKGRLRSYFGGQKIHKYEENDQDYLSDFFVMDENKGKALKKIFFGKPEFDPANKPKLPVSINIDRIGPFFADRLHEGVVTTRRDLSTKLDSDLTKTRIAPPSQFAENVDSVKRTKNVSDSKEFYLDSKQKIPDSCETAISELPAESHTSDNYKRLGNTPEEMMTELFNEKAFQSSEDLLNALSSPLNKDFEAPGDDLCSEIPPCKPVFNPIETILTETSGSPLYSRDWPPISKGMSTENPCLAAKCETTLEQKETEGSCSTKTYSGHFNTCPDVTALCGEGKSCTFTSTQISGNESSSSQADIVPESADEPGKCVENVSSSKMCSGNDTKKCGEEPFALRDAGKDDTEDINEDNRRSELQNIMEHFKKRLIHQCEEDTTVVETNGKEAGSGEKKEIKIAKKRPNCRSKFRHKDLEIYKLGSNTIPTSLCKTKEPYNVCKEKKLQEASENNNEVDRVNRQAIKGRHSLPAIVDRIPEWRKSRSMPTKILEDGNNNLENSCNTPENSSQPSENSGESAEKPEKEIECSNSALLTKITENNSLPVENSNDSSEKLQPVEESSGNILPEKEPQNYSIHSQNIDDSAEKPQRSEESSISTSPMEAAEKNGTAMEKLQEDVSIQVEQESPINLCVKKTKPENEEVAKERPRTVNVPVTNKYPPPVQRNIPTKPSQKIVPISPCPDNQSSGMKNQHPHGGHSLQEDVLHSVVSLMQDRLLCAFTADTLMIMNNWYKYLQQYLRRNHSTPYSTVLVNVLRETEDYVLRNLYLLGSGQNALKIDSLFAQAILTADLSAYKDLLHYLLSTNHRTGNWFNRFYETLKSCIQLTNSHRKDLAAVNIPDDQQLSITKPPQFMPAFKTATPICQEERSVGLPQKTMQSSIGTQPNFRNVTSSNRSGLRGTENFTHYLQSNAISPELSQKMYNPLNYGNGMPQQFTQEMSMMNPSMLSVNQSDHLAEKIKQDMHIAMMRQMYRFIHPVNQGLQIPMMGNASTPVNGMQINPEIRCSAANPVPASQQSMQNLRVPFIDHPPPVQEIHVPVNTKAKPSKRRKDSMPQDIRLAVVNHSVPQLHSVPQQVAENRRTSPKQANQDTRIPVNPTSQQPMSALVSPQQANPSAHVPMNIGLEQLRINDTRTPRAGSQSVQKTRSTNPGSIGSSKQHNNEVCVPIKSRCETKEAPGSKHVPQAQSDERVPTIHLPEISREVRVSVISSTNQSRQSSEQTNPDGVVPVLHIPEVCQDGPAWTDVPHQITVHVPVIHQVSRERPLPTNSGMPQSKHRVPQQAMDRMPSTISSGIPPNTQIQHQDTASNVRRNIRVAGKDSCTTSTIFAGRSTAGPKYKPCTVTSATITEPKIISISTSPRTGVAPNFEKYHKDYGPVQLPSNSFASSNTIGSTLQSELLGTTISPAYVVKTTATTTPRTPIVIIPDSDSTSEGGRVSQGSSTISTPTITQDIEEVIQTNVIVDPVKSKNISNLQSSLPHVVISKDLSSQINENLQLTAIQQNHGNQQVGHIGVRSRSITVPSAKDIMGEAVKKNMIDPNKSMENSSETELRLIKDVLRDQFKDTYPEIVRRVLLAKGKLEKIKHRGTEADREKTISVHSDSTSSMSPKRKTEDESVAATKKMKSKNCDGGNARSGASGSTSHSNTPKPSLPIIEDISSDEDTRPSSETAKAQKPDHQLFRLTKPSENKLPVPNLAFDHPGKILSHPMMQQLQMPNVLPSQLNCSQPIQDVQFSLPMTPESPNVPLPDVWQTWLDEERLRGNRFLTPFPGRRQSIETISSAGSDYSPRLSTEDVEIKIDSKWYRVKRNIYERIPKGKLYYIHQKNMFIRYFDGNQMEQFYRNIGLQNPNRMDSDLLSHMKARVEHNAETFLIPSDPSQVNEIIEVDKEVTFSRADQLREPEMYVEEIENVRRYVPKDFFGFYQFVTGYQIVRHNCPISFHMFLVLHNTNRIKKLLYDYVNALMQGQCIH